MSKRERFFVKTYPTFGREGGREYFLYVETGHDTDEIGRWQKRPSKKQLKKAAEKFKKRQSELADLVKGL